jgi:hypothetical protein
MPVIGRLPLMPVKSCLLLASWICLLFSEMPSSALINHSLVLGVVRDGCIGAVTSIR